jgi:hypothetical protein
MSNDNNRVLTRMGARQLTQNEVKQITEQAPRSSA